MADNDVFGWLFSKDQIQNTPSRQDGMSFEEERATRKSICKLIEEIGQNIRPRVSQIATNSAKVFFHRFFQVQSLKRQDPKMVGITCLFVACKSEECLRPIKQFIWSLNGIETNPQSGRREYPFGRGNNSERPHEIDENSKEFQELKANILSMERVILHVIGFQFNVDHPARYFPRFLRFLNTIRREKETRTLTISDEDGSNSRPSDLGVNILKCANAMANDCNSTSLCLQFNGSTNAVVCLNLAMKLHKFQVQKVPKLIAALNAECANDPDPRIASIKIDEVQVQESQSQLLDVYDTSFGATTIPTPDAPANTASSAVESEPAPAVRPGCPPVQTNTAAPISLSGTNTTVAPPKPTHSVSAPSQPIQQPAHRQPVQDTPLPPPRAQATAADTLASLEAGEVVSIPGSAGCRYELKKRGNVYFCSCTIWRHVPVIESKRTCKHLKMLRGENAELGRVGEDAVLKSDAKFKELAMKSQPPPGSRPHVGPPPVRPNGVGPSDHHNKRPASDLMHMHRDPKRPHP